ncbi:hypothetical protein GCM10009682_47370 [Luedemannella flava]|uniref:DUF3105 domain-containing protein n=2 Tax=Luedemannella flava TaxID=349316 RepID=A0ABP4YQW6_9ACTN
MSTPGDVRRPSTKKVATPAAGAKKSGGSGKGTPTRPAATGGGKGRRPVAPVKVSQGRNWGPIALYVTAGAVALGIVVFATVYLLQNKPDTRPWAERAADISGITNYRETDPKALDRTHAWGPLTYTINPPVGGTHNYNWQNCMGEHYKEPIAQEHAVHSLEHGAVWITYRPDLPQDQVDKLAKKIDGLSYTMLSPYPNLDSPISLQAWGYKLKVDNADDERVTKFIQALRLNATMEEGATCSTGITQTGTTPYDLGKDSGQTSTQ